MQLHSGIPHCSNRSPSTSKSAIWSGNWTYILGWRIFCSGTESLLVDCGHNRIGNHNCDHFKDAGVRCQSKSPRSCTIYMSCNDLTMINFGIISLTIIVITVYWLLFFTDTCTCTMQSMQYCKKSCAFYRTQPQLYQTEMPKNDNNLGHSHLLFLIAYMMHIYGGESGGGYV